MNDYQDLDSDVRFLPGVGPVRKNLLANINIHTARDLIYTFPKRYEDRRSMTELSKISPGNFSSVIVRILDFEEIQARTRKMVISKALVTDGVTVAEAIWFNRRGLERLLPSGQLVALYGKTKRRNNRLQLVSPELEVIQEEEDVRTIGKIIPVYPCTSGLNQIWLRNLIAHALEKFLPAAEEFIPDEIQKNQNLLNLKDAILSLHYPEDISTWKKARYRLVFEEFFILQTALGMRRKSLAEDVAAAPLLCGKKDLRDKFRKDILAFSLTGAQERVIKEIENDMSRTTPMNRLLQGDVGSGKTVVALWAMIAAVENGFQTALMAPTEVLAQQHYSRLKKTFASLGIKCVFLCGSIPARERGNILESISTGKTDVIIGTHALFQEDVNYFRMGLVIIDEQHRFGVIQRKSLNMKGESPHTLVMTATPIPRTLTLSVYGDLSVSVLDELPPGRQEIETRWVKMQNISGLFSFIKKQISSGRQVYWVCPLIEESEKIEATSLVERYESLKNSFPGCRLAMLHGQMKPGEKEETMRNFSSGNIDILVSTTVIEVGVDVPNATIIVIESAERFGLSQLHQLRGRVGRSIYKSYCVLLTDGPTQESKERVKILCSTGDGFRIAEADLKMRGPGELCGLKQHGVTDFRIADIVKDKKILYIAREEALAFLEKDSRLGRAPKLRHRVMKDLGKTLSLIETG